MIIAPFPFDSLPKLTRADVAAQGRVRGFATLAPALEHALGETTKTPVGLRIASAMGAGAGPSVFDAPGATQVQVALAVGEHVIGVAVETALAREIVARALGHAPGIDAGKPASAALHGSFAAVLIHALRSASILARSAQPTSHAVLAVQVVVTLAGATFQARVTVPDDALVPSAVPASLDFPIVLPLVAISCLAARADVEALTAGDVFVPPGLAMSGHCALIAPRAERGFAVELTPEQGLVLRNEREATAERSSGLGRSPNERLRFVEHSWEPPMSETNNPTLEVALEAPVVVRVELGAVEMKAREWAALAEGDVISLQRKLGEPAILRIAGSEVARGELVQVDGEYGIRITSTKGTR